MKYRYILRVVTRHLPAALTISSFELGQKKRGLLLACTVIKSVQNYFYTAAVLGGICSEPGTSCHDANSTCDPDKGKCSCKEGFFDNDGDPSNFDGTCVQSKCAYLAHLCVGSQDDLKLCRSLCRPFTFSNKYVSKTSGPILVNLNLKYIGWSRFGEIELELCSSSEHKSCQSSPWG